MPKPPVTKLPAWYYRLLKEFREIYPEDFDEDLSDLEVGTNCSEEEESGEHEVQGGEIEGNDDEDTENSDYEGSNESEDVESDRSYDGSDADYYYELKEEREDRKNQLFSCVFYSQLESITDDHRRRRRQDSKCSRSKVKGE